MKDGGAVQSGVLRALRAVSPPPIHTGHLITFMILGLSATRSEVSTVSSGERDVPLCKRYNQRMENTTYVRCFCVCVRVHVCVCKFV